MRQLQRRETFIGQCVLAFGAIIATEKYYPGNITWGKLLRKHNLGNMNTWERLPGKHYSQSLLLPLEKNIIEHFFYEK